MFLHHQFFFWVVKNLISVKIGPGICDFEKDVPAHLFVVRKLSLRIVYVHMRICIMHYALC
jgi:hypothetical protein